MTSPRQGVAVRLRRVGVEAAPLLAALCEQAFGESSEVWSAADFAEILSLPTSVALVAEVTGVTEVTGPSAFGADDYPAGFILFTVLALESEILTLGVAPVLRKQKIGGRLVQAAIDYSRAGGVSVAANPDPGSEGRSLFLEVREDNLAALALYQRMGFVQVGRRKAYYATFSGAGADAIVMRFNII